MTERIDQTLKRTIRDEILAGRASTRSLAKAAGISQPMVSRFVTGARPTVSLKTAASLAEVLGLELTRRA